jgi:two-component system chemotaxis sensor kinase CheA
MLEPRFHWSEYERLLMAEAIAKGEDVYNVGIALDTANSMPSAAWQLVRNVLHSCGTVLALRPEDDEDIEKRKAVEAALSSTHTKEALAKRLRIPSVTQQVTVEPAVTPGDVLLDFGALLPQDFAAEPAPVAAQGAAGRTANVSEPHAQFGIEAAAQGEPAAPARPESPAMAAPASKSPQSSAAPRVPASALVEKTLRVDSERIDDVLNLVGELIIGKSMLARTIAEFDRRFQRDALGAKFADALGFQSRILDNLQKSVMKIRMVPVEQLFRRFPRVVRDIAKLRGKDVALSISGQDTDLDKSILEPLAEPITHLIRNCVDHGIEPPEERIAAGKSARGTIHLDAYHQGNQVVIEVGDDGRGIDRKKVVERAIELGFVSREDAAHLTDMEALGLIFVHGFTMARQVTEISGRGVGMDVVQTVLEHLKGTVTVQSALGAGTTFFLRLPLTLASMKALLAEVCGRLYAIPLASVVEITRTTEEEIHVADGQEVFRLRDQVLKLVRLERLAEAPRASASRRLFVIVVALGDRKFGLVVDNLKGEEDLVIKALDNRLAQSEFVNGASILGDGTVVLILNLPIVVSKLSRAAVAEVMA